MGVLIPSGITILEGDLNLMAPEGVSLHYHRYRFTGGKPGDERDVMEGLLKAEDYIADATRLILHARPSVVVFGGTGTSFIGGHGHDKKLIDTMQSITGGLPATTTSTAVIKALKTVGAQKISVAAPYAEGATKAAVNYIEAHGVQVIDVKWLGLAGPDICATNKEIAYQLVKSVDRDESDAVFVSCVDFDVLGIIQPLEKDLGKPVITSNQATMWDMLRLAGIKDQIKGFGRLLSEY
jgi:maleate isomerase